MLVDNAVVVLENIYRRYRLGENPFAAAVKGTYEVLGAVVASTVTTIAVFLPVVFIEEEAGQLFRDIALAISGAVGLSLVVSMTLIPAASAPLPRRERAWRRRKRTGKGRLQRSGRRHASPRGRGLRRNGRRDESLDPSQYTAPPGDDHRTRRDRDRVELAAVAPGRVLACRKSQSGLRNRPPPAWLQLDTNDAAWRNRRRWAAALY